MRDQSPHPVRVVSSNIPVPPKNDIDKPADFNAPSENLTTKELEIAEKDKDRRDKRYLRALWLIVGCLAFLGIIYFVEVFASIFLKGELSSHTDGIIEIIKTLLFTLSGYLFAKKEDKD